MKPIVIIGQIASGKTTLAHCLESAGFKRIKEYTTRKPREGQDHSGDYCFISDDDFSGVAEAGEFAAHVDFNAKFGYVRYGIRKADLLSHAGQYNVLVTNPRSLIQLKEAEYDVFTVYLDFEQEILMRRALARGDNPAEIGRRIATDERAFQEVTARGYVDLRIINPDLPPYKVRDMIRDCCAVKE